MSVVAHGGRALALANVCFEGKKRHDADVTRCLLMTQSGHVQIGSDG
jgi:hypothetical protein